MSDIHVRGITIEQMQQLIEMTKFFYEDENNLVYQDPDFPDNIIITSRRGDNHNTICWFQACFDLILPKISDSFYKGEDIIESYHLFTEAVGTHKMCDKHHPVDMLYLPFLAIKSEKDAIDKRREKPTSNGTTSKT